MGLLHRDRVDHDTVDHDQSEVTDDAARRDRTEPELSRSDDAAVVRHGDADAVPPAQAAAGDGRDIRPDDTTPAVVRERSWTFAPGQLISLIAGGALVAVGVLALIRAGVSRPLDSPVEQVLGWDHTGWLGLSEIGLGALLMLVGTGAWGRPISVLVGAATVIAGVLVLAEPGSMPDELGIERSFGWPLIALGAIVALAAMALPVWRSHRSNVRTIDVRDGHEREANDREIHDRAGHRGRFWSRH